jgi:NAD(P)-dependent dehydrogenase (short-subunit alcohol dehydrogenase family)
VEVPGSVALVTGGNRGFGASLCAALVERGATKVYAAARDVSTVTTPGVEAVPLDITSPADVEAAVAHCRDVTLLINNAGIGTGTGVLADDAMVQLQREFDTNVFGPLAMSQAFAPVLAANGGGAMVNVLSVLSWLAAPPMALYCAAKAASWSLTNSLRLELAAQHTQVVAVHVGFMDTDMTARLNVPKSSPDEIARLVLDAVQDGHSEVLADDATPREGRAVQGADAAVPGDRVVIAAWR